MASALCVVVLALGLAVAAPTVSPAPDALPELVVQRNGGGQFNVVGVTPDRRFYLTASGDSLVKVWDLENGYLVRNIDVGRTVSPAAVCLLPDGKTIAVGAANLAVWSLETGTRTKVLNPSGSVIGLLAVPDGKNLIINTGGSQPVVFNVPAKKTVRALGLPRMVKFVRHMALSADMKRFAAVYEFDSSHDCALAVIDFASGESLWEIRLEPGAYPRSLEFSPDGSMVLLSHVNAAQGRHQPTVEIRSAADGRLAFTFKDRALARFAPDSRRVFAAASGRTLECLSLTDGSSRPVPGIGQRPQYLFWTGSGDEAIIQGSSVEGPAVADLGAGKILRRFNPMPTHYYDPGEFAVDGPTAWLILDYSLLKIDLLAGRVMRAAKLPRSFWHFRLASDGRKIAALAYDDDTGFDRLAVLEPGKPFAERGTATAFAKIFDVKFVPDGRTLLAAGELKAAGSREPVYGAQLIDIASGTVLRSYEPLARRITSLALAADGRGFALGTVDSGVLCFDMGAAAPQWQQRSGLAGDQASDTFVRFAADGTSLFTFGNFQRTLRWDRAGGARLPVLADDPDGASLPAGSQVDDRGAPGVLLAVSGTDLWRVGGDAPPSRLTGSGAYIMDAFWLPDQRHAVSAVMDGTIRVWDTETGGWVAIVASTDGSEWINFTQDGYWDGSASCGSLVGMSSGLDFWRIDQFAARNNRPDIILERLGNRDAGLKAHYRDQYLKRLRRLGFVGPDGQPAEDRLAMAGGVPRVRIVGQSRQGSRLELKLAFSSAPAANRPLAAYAIHVNDVPVSGEGGILSGRAAELSVGIELIPGRNKVEVSCWDTGGAESLRVPLVVDWNGPAKPELWYLALGVSDYADPGIRDLRYAAKDATDLGERFQAMAGRGYAAVHRQVLTNGQVTRPALAEAKAFLAQARPEDTVVLFIAGHGIQYAQNANNRPVYYYLGAEAKLADLPGTAIDFAGIESLLQGIAARRKLFLMDTCQSGEYEGTAPAAAAVAAGSTRGLQARAIDAGICRGLSVIPSAVRQALAERDRWIYNDLVRRTGAIVLSSSRGDEYSLESDGLRQGLFTSAVLEALAQAAADADRDGRVDSREIQAWVGRRVPELSGGAQHPVVDRDNLSVTIGFPAGAGRP
jgi:WD40 repeat protein/uncharacterized caspase-like protein